MSGTETKIEPISIGGGIKISAEQPPLPKPEPSKLIIELTNLSEGSVRTVKRDLKILIEDYGYSKMISGCIQVKEASQ